MPAASAQTLGQFTLDWLVRYIRQQQQLFPPRFVDIFKSDYLTVAKKLTVTDQVDFKAYGNWRYVGSQGQPVFANSWVNFGAPYQNASFTKTADDIVLLHGVIKSGTLGSAAFTLPSGYRPEALITVPTLSNNAFGRVDIGTDGTVTPQSPSSNLSVVLDGLWFKTK